MVVASIGPSLPGLAAGTGVTLGAVSAVFAGYRGGYMLGSVAGGALLDRLPGNPLMAGVLLAMAAVLAFVPAVPYLALLVTAFVTLGVLAGALEVGGNTLLLWRYGDRSGPYMGALHFAFGIGAILSPLLIGRAVRLTGALAGGYLAAAALMLPGALLLVKSRSPRSPEPEAAQERAQDVILPTLLIALLLLLYVGAESSFGGWVYTYAVRSFGFAAERASQLTSVFWAALTGGRPLDGDDLPVDDGAGRKPLTRNRLELALVLRRRRGRRYEHSLAPREPAGTLWNGDNPADHPGYLGCDGADARCPTGGHPPGCRVEKPLWLSQQLVVE